MLCLSRCLICTQKDYSITQTRGCFDDHLLNDSLAVQRLHVKVHGGASQSFLDDVAPFCNLIRHGEILPRGTKVGTRVFIRLFSTCDEEAGHEISTLNDENPKC